MKLIETIHWTSTSKLSYYKNTLKLSIGRDSLKDIDVSDYSISNTPSPDQDTFQLRAVQSSSRRG